MTDQELLAAYGAPKAGYESGYQTGYEASGDGDGSTEGDGEEAGAMRKRPVIKRPRPNTDVAFGGALREGGSAMPSMAVGHAEGLFANASTFTLTFVSQARTVVTGFALTAGLGVLRSVTCTAGPGQPIAGFAAFNIDRFNNASGVNNNRIPPFILESGITFTLSGTVATTNPSEYINLDVLGIAVSTALKLANG